MRKKNGFISMSIIYSFFTVFILISTSLLLIYSNNLAIVKSVNKEIKTNLTNKGNNSLIVIKNLIQDGSFENPSANWKYKSGTNPPVYDQQRYYGNQSLGMVRDNTTPSSINYVQSTYTINMIKNHYYYVSRIYLAYNNIYPSYLTYRLIPSSSADFTDSGGFDILAQAYGVLKKTGCDNVIVNDECLYGNISINRERFRYQSGFCLNVNGRCTSDTANTEANTYESGIFKFTGTTGNYKILLGANFTNYTESSFGILPRYYTDGYMLIDLTEALKLDEDKKKILFDNKDNKNGYRIGAAFIDKLLDGRFIEYQRTIPVNKLALW